MIQDRIMKDLAPLLDSKFNELYNKNQEKLDKDQDAKNKQLCEKLDAWDVMVRERVGEIVSGQLDELIETKIKKLLKEARK